jgi:exodeoxyribonuclease-5
VCAYTGRAASVLRQRGVVRAATIHSTIYHPVQLSPDGPVTFRRKDPATIGCEGFLVDEAAMVAKEMQTDLLSYGKPVAFVGDHGQLEPFGDDAGSLMEDPDHRLETLHRNAGSVARFAEHVREAGSAVDWTSESNRVRIFDEHDVTDRMLLKTDQIICAFNESRVKLNDRVRSLLGRTELIEAGDRVMVLRNNRQRGLFNGQQGVVRRVDLRRRLLDLEADDGTVHAAVAFKPEAIGQERFVTWTDGWRPDAPVPFDYSYAITCHKAAGGEWDRALVFEQVCRHWDHARWCYTAASRARRRLDWVCS